MPYDGADPKYQSLYMEGHDAPKSAFDRFFEETNGWDDMTVRANMSPEALALRFRERLLKQSMTVWARLPYGLDIR